MNNNRIIVLCIAIIILFLSSPFISAIPISSGDDIKTVDQLPISKKLGNILYVGGSGPNNYTKIQDAIDDAVDGDTVFVYDDSSPYFENVIVNKRIYLIGEKRDTTIIDGKDKDDVILITADNVIISNFNIQNCKEDWHHAGIKIQSDYNEISNNNLQFNYRIDIQIDRSSFNIIENNNIISDCAYGIQLEKHSNNNYISNNIIQDHSTGIMIWRYSNYTTIINNIIHDGVFGIRTYGFSSIIANNTISNMRDGINLHNSQQNIIENNEFVSCGIVLEDSKFNIVNNNTINGRPLIYLQDESFKDINFDTGQIIIINCEFIKIENQEIFDATIGITIRDSNHCQINKCNVSLNHNYGLLITGSSDFTISKNKFLLNGKGIFITESNEIEIIENTANNNYNGIFIFDSKNILIQNNNISYNKGLGLDIYSEGAKIFHNNISHNNEGIFIIKGGNKISYNIFYSNNEYGIRCDFYESNNYISNNIFKNNCVGLYINGKNNVVRNNHFENNELGIYVSKSDEGKITNNNFINNNRHATFHYSGRESLKNNKWKGNYWQRFRIFPVIIFGKFDIRIHWGYWKTYLGLQIDWFPAFKPYDI